MNKKIFQICLKTVEETKTKKKSIKDCILELQPSKKKKKDGRTLQRHKTKFDYF